MRSSWLFVCLILISAKLIMVAEPNSLSIETDAAKLKYRVLVHLGSEGAEYDSLDLTPIASGLAPRGARVIVKDESSHVIACGNGESGYSSAELYSGSPVFK
jgi:hypothetical protein